MKASKFTPNQERVAYWFARGYRDARSTVRHARQHSGGLGYCCSSRMAHERYPSANSTDISVYLEGYCDGLTGDTFRLYGATSTVTT